MSVMNYRGRNRLKWTRPRNVDLRIVVTTREDMSDISHVWTYDIQRPDGLVPSADHLYSTIEMPLYPGHEAIIIGEYLEGNRILLTGIEMSRFLLGKGDVIELCRPKKGEIENATYAPKIYAVIHDKRIRLDVPVVLYGKTIDNPDETPAAVVMRVEPPLRRKCYLLRAEPVD